MERYADLYLSTQVKEKYVRWSYLCVLERENKGVRENEREREREREREQLRREARTLT